MTMKGSEGIKFYKNKYCACGCNGKIPIRKYHRYAGRDIPRYLNGHFNKGTQKVTCAKIMEMCSQYQNGMNTIELAKKYNVTHSTISEWLKFYGVRLRTMTEVARRIYSLNKRAFDKLTPEGVYWLGFIYADGYICESKNCLTVKLKSSDRIILEEFKKFLRSSHPIKIAKSNEHRALRIVIKDKYFVNRLRELGLHQKKSLDLEFPTCLPENLYSDFIRGYFDGDGCLYRNEKVPSNVLWEITSTKNFLSRVQQILMKECDLKKTKFRIDSEVSAMAVLRYGGRKQVQKIAKFLVTNEGFYLTRKLGKILICRKEEFHELATQS